jgi:uncharacterized lipoprotein YajG
MKKIFLPLVPLTMILLFEGCDFVKGSDYKIGDCLMEKKSTSPASIVKIVGKDNRQYKYFSHFISDGKLIQGEDYLSKEISEVNKNYLKIECPIIDGTFSPDKFLNN